MKGPRARVGEGGILLTYNITFIKRCGGLGGELVDIDTEIQLTV
jgi:hypothetical protein